jgi:hypothetical protein
MIACSSPWPEDEVMQWVRGHCPLAVGHRRITISCRRDQKQNRVVIENRGIFISGVLCLQEEDNLLH